MCSLHICDICLTRDKTQLIGFYIDEENNIHLNQNSRICKTCLNRIKIEIIGTRDLRRVETASYRFYKKG